MAKKMIEHFLGSGTVEEFDADLYIKIAQKLIVSNKTNIYLEVLVYLKYQ